MSAQNPLTRGSSALLGLMWIALWGFSGFFLSYSTMVPISVERGLSPVTGGALLLVMMGGRANEELPVFVFVAFNAIIPLMTVVNYSVQDILSPTQRIFVGTEWFKAVMRDGELHDALLRQILFSLSVLAVWWKNPRKTRPHIWP